MQEFRTKELYADFYENKGKPLLIIIGGSRKGIWSISKILLDYLLKHYSVLIFAYFGVGELPKNLSKVPLEYFINGINIIKSKLNLKDEDITIVANSKGAEAALLLVSKHINAKAVVACVPSCYVWQGLVKNFLDFIFPKSSWTLNGKQLPFIKFRYNRKILKDIKNKIYLSCSIKSISENKNNKVLIDLKEFKGKLLLLSSDSDNYWPSKDMCDTIVQNFKINVTHKVLNLTGHYFQDYEESVKEIIDFLDGTR
jgi:hypothetical protein